MKLYYAKGACSLAVRIIINELAVPCEFEAVNLKTHLTENDHDYYLINPKGAVPALKIDSKTVLTENNVIQQYLADTYDKAAALLPKSGIERYEVLSWMNFICTDLHKACSPFFNSAISDELKSQIFKPMLNKKLAYLDNHLASNDYLHGNSFSLPDAYLFIVLRWLPALKINREDYNHLEAYFERMKSREAVKKSLQQEQL